MKKKLTKTQLIYCLISHITDSILPTKKTRRKFGGIFGTKLSDGVREYSGNETLKNLKAYYYETRSEVAIVGSPGWSLATQTEKPDLQDIAKNSSFQVNPMVYLKH